MNLRARSVRAATAAFAALVLLAVGERDLCGKVPEGERLARKHHQVAEVRFRAGLFAEALAEYQAGYQVMPLPGFLINIAQCYRRLGDLKMASSTYRRFTVVAPTSPLTPQIKALIVEIDRRSVDFENARQNGTTPIDDHWNDDADQVMPYALFVNPPAREAEGEDPAPALLVQKVPAFESEPRAGRGARWWLWGSIATVILGGAVAAIVLSTSGSAGASEGSLATLRR